MSAIFIEIVKNGVQPNPWSKEFLATFGSCEGAFPEVNDLPPQKRPALDDF